MIILTGYYTYRRSREDIPEETRGTPVASTTTSKQGGDKQSATATAKSSVSRSSATVSTTKSQPTSPNKSTRPELAGRINKLENTADKLEELVRRMKTSKGT
jgi:hypothetical protein